MTTSSAATTSPKIAIVGAGGLVGTAIVRRLHSEHLPVVALVRNTLAAAIMEALIPGCEVRIGGVNVAGDTERLLGDCATVVNCALAGSGGVPANAYTRNEAIVDGILAAPTVMRLIHFSSVAVYGEIFGEAQNASSAFASPKPNSEYGRSKLHVERYAVKKGTQRRVAVTALRLGHVYGPGVFRSREIIEIAQDPRFGLPFGGRYLSNAIHLETVSSAILALIQRGAVPEVANLFEPAQSWRDVFDWHCHALGLSLVADMPESASRRAQQGYLDRSVARATVRWAKSLSVGELVRSPAVFDVGLRTLARSPKWLTMRAKAANRKMKSRRHAAPDASQTTWPSLYFSEGAPGPNYQAPAADELALRERMRALADWHRRITEPRLP